uniref:Nucleoprotein TPR/MLP1 domain-containing protein n=1 Tax=Setaria digitata TaxID=48799 RepID=A0A915PT54_9BILA
MKEHSALADEFGRMCNATSELEKKVTDLEKSVEGHVIQATTFYDILEQHNVREQEASKAITESQFKIARLNEIIDKIKSDHSAELKRIQHEYRETEMKIDLEKETRMENYDETIYALRKNKEDLEKSLAVIEKEMKELFLRYENVTFEKERLCTQLNEEKERYEKEITLLQQQLDAIKERYFVEIAEWERIQTEKDSSYNRELLEMKDNVKALNDKLQESQETQSSLNRKMVDLNLLVEHEKDAIKRYQIELSKKDEEMKFEMKKLDEERHNWNEKLRLKNEELAQARCNIEHSQAKCLELENTLRFVECRLDKKTEKLTMMENELKQTENQIATRIDEERSLKSSLADNEREKIDLKAEREELRNSLQTAYNHVDELKNNEAALRKELGMMKSKLNDEEDRTEKLSNELKHLKNENKKLEVALSEKINHSSSLAIMLKQFENTQKETVKELGEEKGKCSEAQKTVETLETENLKLSNELANVRNVLEQKIALNQRAMDDMLRSYQSAEKGRIDAISEKESIVEELNSLKNRLASEDAKRMNIEQKLVESELIRKNLSKKVANFENSARKVLSFAKARNISPFRSYTSEMDTKIVGDGFSRSDKGSLRRSSSASPHVHFDLNTDDELISPENLSITSSVEITFQYLRNRIGELEQTKANDSTTLIRLKADNEQLSEENQKNIDKIRLLERKLVNLEEDKRILESRLSSSRQLLVSQEEGLRARENERKALKSRVVSADLHARDKEARICSLNEQVLALKTELAAMENEQKKFEKSRTIWEEEKLFYESACKDADTKMEKYQTEMKLLISAKNKLEERLKEMEHSLSRTQEQCGELEKVNKEYRNMLEEAKVDNDSKDDQRTKIDSTHLLSKLNTLQHEYDNCLLRLRTSDLEKQSLKNNLDEARNRQKQTSQRIANMQHKLEEQLEEKNCLQERLNVMEKLRAEKVMLFAENEELKRRLNRADVEHREFDACRARLERERSALKRNIETLETEKERTDAALRQITNERQALDKSLTTMEKENMELYRNCTQLQNQVTQLEKENSLNLVKESTAQIRALENKVKQIHHERQQTEQLLEQRELAYAQKIKLLESKIVLLESKIVVLKEQLDTERKRRLEVVERTAIIQRDPRELRSGLDDSVSAVHQHSLNLPREHHQLSAAGSRIRAQSLSSNFFK